MSQQHEAGQLSAAFGRNRTEVRRALAGAESKQAAWNLCAGIVEHPPGFAERMRVGVLIRMCRSTGWGDMRRLLIRADIRFESNLVGGLTDRQRRELVAALRVPRSPRRVVRPVHWHLLENAKGPSA
jgi:hypothetical protein